MKRKSYCQLLVLCVLTCGLPLAATPANNKSAGNAAKPSIVQLLQGVNNTVQLGAQVNGQQK
jgi:hypothetical protein